MAIQLQFCEVLLPGICWKQHAASLCDSHLVFLPAFFEIKVVQLYSSALSHLILGRIPILFKRSDFHVVDNLSITVHILPMCMLTLHSVDEIFPEISQVLPSTIFIFSFLSLPVFVASVFMQPWVNFIKKE